MYIVSHIGGTCGDLVTAVIDSTDASIDWTHAVKMPKTRLTLKTKINTDEDITQYLLEIFDKYKSISSHLPISDILLKDNIKLITPVIHEKEIALWAANRFVKVNLKKPYNHFMNRLCKNDEEYADILLEHSKFSTEIKPNTNTILINVRDIVEGNLITKLQNYMDTELDNNFYQQWLSYDINRM